MRDASCYQLSTTITNCNETTERHGTDKSCLHSCSEREREYSKASMASGQNNISAVLNRIKLQLSWRQLISQTDSLCYFPLTHNISEIKVSDNEDHLLICRHSGLVSRALTTIDIWQILQLLKFYQISTKMKMPSSFNQLHVFPYRSFFLAVNRESKRFRSTIKAS